MSHILEVEAEHTLLSLVALYAPRYCEIFLNPVSTGMTDSYFQPVRLVNPSRFHLGAKLRL